jgi:S-DNA-T family DNA segregation ATPase FtsK/SpoIIIE
MGQLGLSRETRDGHKQVLGHGPIRLTDHGITTTVDLSPLGLTIRKHLRPQREAMESSFRVQQVQITRRAVPGLAQVDMRHTDPLEKPVAVDRLPAAHSRTGVVTSVDESGRGVELDTALSHLVIGAPGAGKSTVAWALLWVLKWAGVPVRVRMFDPKKQEFAALRDAAYAYESSLARWPAMLGHAVSALQARQGVLAKRGWQKLTGYSDENPLDLLIVDELLAVTKVRSAEVTVGRVTMRADDALELLASQGRAAGFTVLGLAQLAQKDVLGQVRDLFGYATCLRVPPQAHEMVNVVLGDGAAEHYPAHEIQAGPRTAGMGYTRTESGLIVRTRGAVLTAQQQQQVVAQIAADTARWAAVKQERRERAGAAA